MCVGWNAKEEFNKSTVTLDLPHPFTTEAMQMNTGPLSEVEMIGELGFHETHDWWIKWTATVHHEKRLRSDCGDIPPDFTKRNGFRQGCLL